MELTVLCTALRDVKRVSVMIGWSVYADGYKRGILSLIMDVIYCHTDDV